MDSIHSKSELQYADNDLSVNYISLKAYTCLISGFMSLLKKTADICTIIPLSSSTTSFACICWSPWHSGEANFPPHWCDTHLVPCRPGKQHGYLVVHTDGHPCQLHMPCWHCLTWHPQLLDRDLTQMIPSEERLLWDGPSALYVPGCCTDWSETSSHL